MGCPYEFIKCYLKKNDPEEDDISIDFYYPDDIEQNNKNKNDENEMKELTPGVIICCVFLAIIGVFLQPLYLLFYVLYGMMECYRRWGCWIFMSGSF